MAWLLNGIYALGIVLITPWLLARAHRRKLLPTRLVGGESLIDLREKSFGFMA